MKKEKKPYCKVGNKEHFDIGPGHPMYCCKNWIDGWVNEDAVPVSYNPYIRFYYIMCYSKTWVQTISRCIVCNHEFPRELGEEWIVTLEKEYGLDEVTAWRHPERVPEEFKSEEWWRKREL
jgi:hypothetical protein